MTSASRSGRLEIEEDHGFQRTERRVMRVGWLVIAIVLLSAVLGFFGAGPVGSASVSSHDGALRADIERFARASRPTVLHIEVAHDLARNGEFQVDIDREFALRLEIQSVTPSPDSVEVVGDAYRYSFTQQEADAALEVFITYLPQALWKVNGTVTVPGGPAVHFWTFVYL